MNDRIKRYGVNVPKPIVIKSFCQLVYEQLEDLVLRILIVSAIIALVLGLLKEGLSTVIFILISRVGLMGSG